MTDDEARAELARHWRLTAALCLKHGTGVTVMDGSTMGTTPAELRAAAHALLDHMLDRLESRVADAPDVPGPAEGEP